VAKLNAYRDFALQRTALITIAVDAHSRADDL
jgi:hypothetical protein